MEFPPLVEFFLIIVQIVAVLFFAWLLWPLIKNEEWRKKFIENKVAFSLLVTFILVLLFAYGVVSFFDWLAPVELVD